MGRVLTVVAPLQPSVAKSLPACIGRVSQFFLGRERTAPLWVGAAGRRPHMSLANPYPGTPAMAAGVSDHVRKMEEIVALLDS
jgi:hypothetical protein